MYARTTSLTILYIRKIIPDDMSIPFWGAWPYRGGAKRFFSSYMEEKFRKNSPKLAKNNALNSTKFIGNSSGIHRRLLAWQSQLI
jgi:hypothetical protein